MTGMTQEWQQRRYRKIIRCNTSFSSNTLGYNKITMTAANTLVFSGEVTAVRFLHYRGTKIITLKI